MDGELITWIFLIGGIVLMLLEALIPGGVTFILGFSGLAVGVFRYLGFLEDPFTATFTWLFSSMALTILIRPFIKKYFPGETSFKFADEDYEAMDQVVDVVEPINEFDSSGRIRYQGISWQARSMEGKIPIGTKVRIKYRENTTWIVEPVDRLDPQKTQLKDKNRN
ncbi:MAG: NfeD family protein [Bacteroidetes bacterium]|jgi:membrane protein implicated in regulation of membrane protease activity|nr:NfeD family protein [Bacteroidota bacterium]